MAYIDQQRKGILEIEIKKVMPKNWKYTLKIRNHSTLSMTIRQADVDLIDANINAPRKSQGRPEYISLNEHHLQGEYTDKLLAIFQSIKGAMCVGNHDNSDIQSDYFDVGWYVSINIGEYKSPFRYVPKCDGSHPFILPNGDCRDCGVFVTSVPGLAQGHTMV